MLVLVPVFILVLMPILTPLGDIWRPLGVPGDPKKLPILLLLQILKIPQLILTIVILKIVIAIVVLVVVITHIFWRQERGDARANAHDLMPYKKRRSVTRILWRQKR